MAARMSKPPLPVDCRVKLGNDDMKNHSRGARLRPSFAKPLPRSREDDSLPSKKPRERSAEKAHPSIRRACEARQCGADKCTQSAQLIRIGRARLSALHCGAWRSDRTLRLSPGRASREREDASITRAIIRA